MKEGLKRLLFTVDRIARGRSVVGLVGATPRLEDYSTTKVKTVTFNRCLSQVIRSLEDEYRVEFPPWHFHFLDTAGEFLQPISRYFTPQGEYTLAVGMVLREVLLKSVGVIPMDGHH